MNPTVLRNKAKIWLQQALSPELLAISAKVTQSGPKLAITESNKEFITILCPAGHITNFPTWVVMGGKPPGRGFRKVRAPKRVFCHTCTCKHRVYRYLLTILAAMLGLPFCIEYMNPDRAPKSAIKRLYNDALGLTIVIINTKNETTAPADAIKISNNYSGDYASDCEFLHALADEVQQKIIAKINEAPTNWHPWIRELVYEYEYNYPYPTAQNKAPILGNLEDLTYDSPSEIVEVRPRVKKDLI